MTALLTRHIPLSPPAVTLPVNPAQSRRGAGIVPTTHCAAATLVPVVLNCYKAYSPPGASRIGCFPNVFRAFTPKTELEPTAYGGQAGLNRDVRRPRIPFAHNWIRRYFITKPVARVSKV